MIQRRTISHDGAVTIIGEGKLTDTGETLTIGDIQELIVRSWPAMETMIVESMPRGAEPGTLGDMVWYQLDTGGKRLRAILPLVVQRAMGGDKPSWIPQERDSSLPLLTYRPGAPTGRFNQRSFFIK